MKNLCILEESRLNRYFGFYYTHVYLNSFIVAFKIGSKSKKMFNVSFECIYDNMASLYLKSSLV